MVFENSLNFIDSDDEKDDGKQNRDIEDVEEFEADSDSSEASFDEDPFKQGIYVNMYKLKYSKCDTYRFWIVL